MLLSGKHCLHALRGGLQGPIALVKGQKLSIRALMNGEKGDAAKSDWPLLLYLWRAAKNTGHLLTVCTALCYICDQSQSLVCIAVIVLIVERPQICYSEAAAAIVLHRGAQLVRDTCTYTCIMRSGHLRCKFCVRCSLLSNTES